MSTPNPAITRRTLLRGAAGGAALVAGAGLPAWARPALAAHTHIRQPDSLPFPHLPAGTETMHKIEHIVVLMMENHSFDNLLGMVPYQVKGRHLVDGLTRRHGKLTNFNRDATGAKVFAQHAPSPCQLDAHPSQSWNASHEAYANGRNSGFVTAELGGPIAMNFWDKDDLPFTYSLVRHFPLGERYFCSALCQTYPNRRYLFSGTSSGLVATNLAQTLSTPAANGTIWERMTPTGSTGASTTSRFRATRSSPARCDPARTSSDDRSSTRTRRPASCPRSRSWIPTTTPPPRRTPRTSRSARSSWPASCRR